MLSYSLRRENIEETLGVSNLANGSMGLLNLVVMWIPVLFLSYVRNVRVRSTRMPIVSLAHGLSLECTREYSNIITKTQTPKQVPPEDSSFYEKFATPNREQALYLFLNGFLAFLFNVSFVVSLSLTSAFITSIACVTTIPLAALTDYLLWNDVVGWYFVSGSVLIMIGFIVLLRVSSNNSEKKSLEEALLESPSSVSTASYE